jgi:hypothetical protein
MPYVCGVEANAAVSLADCSAASEADVPAGETTWSAADLEVSAEEAPDSDTADTAEVEAEPVSEAESEAGDDPAEDDEDDPYAGTSDSAPALAAAWAPEGTDWSFICAAVT